MFTILFKGGGEVIWFSFQLVYAWSSLKKKGIKRLHHTTKITQPKKNFLTCENTGGLKGSAVVPAV